MRRKPYSGDCERGRSKVAINILMRRLRTAGERTQNGKARRERCWGRAWSICYYNINNGINFHKPVIELRSGRFSERSNLESTNERHETLIPDMQCEKTRIENRMKMVYEPTVTMRCKINLWLCFFAVNNKKTVFDVWYSPCCQLFYDVHSLRNKRLSLVI